MKRYIHFSHVLLLVCIVLCSCATQESNNGWALENAVKHGDVSAVSSLLRNEDVHPTALHPDYLNYDLIEAVRLHNKDIAELLVDAGAPINIGLIESGKIGDIDMIRFFLERGANINEQKNCYVFSEPLPMKVGSGVNCVGMKIFEKPEGDCALSAAIRNQHVEAVKFLIAHGASVKRNATIVIKDCSINYPPQDGIQRLTTDNMFRLVKDGLKFYVNAREDSSGSKVIVNPGVGFLMAWNDKGDCLLITNLPYEQAQISTIEELANACGNSEIKTAVSIVK